MAQTPTPVEVRQATPARMPDVWQSLRGDMDRLFDHLQADLACRRSAAYSMSNQPGVVRAQSASPHPPST